MFVPWTFDLARSRQSSVALFTHPYATRNLPNRRRGRDTWLAKFSVVVLPLDGNSDLPNSVSNTFIDLFDFRRGPIALTFCRYELTWFVFNRVYSHLLFLYPAGLFIPGCAGVCLFLLHAPGCPKRENIKRTTRR